jgi:hypothetical protein
LLRRAGHALVVLGRLVVFEVHRCVDDDDIAAAVGIRERPDQRHDSAVVQFTRLHELDDLAIRAGVVTVLAVKHFELRAVRVHAVDIDGTVDRGIIPAAEHDLPVRQNRRIEIVRLIIRNLFDGAAIRVHDVQNERRFVLILVFRRELRLALVQQHGIGAQLSRRRENDAAVRQILRTDVMPDFGGEVGRDNAPQHISLERVFPDIPGRLVFVV